MSGGFTLRQEIKPLRGSIPATSTVDVDAIEFASFFGAKYLVQFANVTQNKFKRLTMDAERFGASDVSDSIHSVLTNGLNISINFLIVGSDAVLRITNSESFQINYSVKRIMNEVN